MAGTPLINGQVHSAANVEMQVNGAVVYNVKEIDYDTTQEVTEVMGLQADPVAFSKGKKQRKGSITLGFEEIEAIRKKIPSRSLLDAQFTIVVSYVMGLTSVVHTLTNCVPKNDPTAVKSGDNELQGKIDLFIGNIQN